MPYCGHGPPFSRATIHGTCSTAWRRSTSRPTPSSPRRRVLATSCATPSSASAALVLGHRPRAEQPPASRPTPRLLPHFPVVGDSDRASKPRGGRLMILITGASGNVGGEVLKKAVAAHLPIRAAYQSAAKAKSAPPG